MGSPSNRDAVLRHLRDHPERIEKGLEIVDPELRLSDDVVVDLFARDTLGHPVAVLVSEGDVGGELGRLASIHVELRNQRFALERAYRSRKVDFRLPTRFVLVAARFSEASAAVLELFEGLDVLALEAVTVESGADVHVDLSVFHRGGAAPRRTRPSEGEGGAGGPGSSRQLFLRARDAVRSLSQRVVERVEDGVVIYEADGEGLAAFALDHDGFRADVGCHDDWRPIADEPGLDDALNAVFTLYFDRLDPDATLD